MTLLQNEHCQVAGGRHGGGRGAGRGDLALVPVLLGAGGGFGFFLGGLGLSVRSITSLLRDRHG